MRTLTVLSTPSHAWIRPCTLVGFMRVYEALLSDGSAQTLRMTRTRPERDAEVGRVEGDEGPSRMVMDTGRAKGKEARDGAKLAPAPPPV